MAKRGTPHRLLEQNTSPYETRGRPACHMPYRDTAMPQVFYRQSIDNTWTCHIHMYPGFTIPTKGWLARRDFWETRKLAIEWLVEQGDPVAELLLEASREL